MRNEAESELIGNVCSSCGASRDLPFDLGEDFHCADAGFECSERLLENVGGLEIQEEQENKEDKALQNAL